MKNWSIQRRVLLIALLPAGILAIVLSTYNAYRQIQGAEQRALRNARAVAAEIEPIASHLATGAHDDALLRDLANTLVADRNAVDRITVRDHGDNVLLQVTGGESGTFDTDPGIVRITRTITNSATPDIPPSGTHAADSLGTLEIAVNLGRARQEQIVPLLEGLTLTVFALGITALVAVRIGRSVTDPVHALVRGIDRIRSGEYDYPPRVDSGGELGQLERGIRELTAGIAGRQRSLQDRIEEATRELQDTLAKLEERNAELESARREAEAASEFKSRFLANISHEIRTPMNSILGFTELLERADLDPVSSDYLITIQNSAQSLLSLLNGILDLSKIESGHMDLEYADTDVNALLFETFNLLAPQTYSRGVEFIVKPAPARNAIVRVDSVRLKQVLINLTSNAVKFTDSGYVQISAETAPRADGGVALTLSFVDTGRGIPHAAQARLFQAFAQGEDIRGDERPRPTGTGLGLHIASEIVFLMDGLIEFRSEPGAGSEFWFTLELEHAHGPPGRSWEWRSRRRILLVIDGNPDFVATHVSILATAGIDADPVGMDQLDSNWPDMAAIDAVLVHIPAEDAHAGNPPDPRSIPSSDTPILAYVYAEGPEIHRRLHDVGFASVVQKTPDPKVLRNSLERALNATTQDDFTPLPPQRTEVRGDTTAPRKILMVDDQPVNLKLFESFLEGTGWETVAATGSDEALYHARLTRFDAILMDIHLPERDGIETSALLRRPGELNAYTPILAITADAFAEQAHAAMAAGMNDVLVKPVSRSILLERLAEWCRPGEADTQAQPETGNQPHDDASPPCYDPDDARTRAGGREQVADELFAMLCEHLPSSREELLSAHERNDLQALLAAAHRLKGAAAYCGVPRLRHDIAALEDRLREGEDGAGALEEVRRTIDTLLRLYGSDATRGQSDHA